MKDHQGFGNVRSMTGLLALIRAEHANDNTEGLLLCTFLSGR